jgi:hypothetical protein
LSVAITIVAAAGGTIPYTVYGGSVSGSGTGGSGTGGSGVYGSGVRPSGTASGVVVGGHAAYTVAFGWQSFPTNQISASEVVETAPSPSS